MKTPGAILLASAFAAAAAFTSVANSYYVFIMGTLALTAIAGIGLNVLVGLSGQVSFGHVGFYALGAYAVAILTTAAKIDFWLALPVAGLLAGVVGALLAAPALRVRGPYLAMVTIAFGFIVEHSAVEWRGLTGGQNGIMGIQAPVVLGLAFGERGAALAAIAVAALLTLGFWMLSRSSLGAAMRAVRDAEFAAASIGLDPVRIKVAAFVISAVCAGIAGALFAPLSGFVTPSTFTFMQSILFVLVVVVGGAGTVAGPLVGALVVVVLPELLAGLAEYRLLFFGALLLAVLWGAPEGIVGEIARWLRRRSAATTEQTPRIGDLPQPANGSTAIVVEGLSIAFGGVRAASDVSFSARPGEVTSLIGPNGAGKTTVLNMLGGFYRPDAGAIRLGEQRIESRAAHRIARAGVARTYQTSQLFGSLSVIDNLALAARRGTVSMRALEAENLRGLLAFVGYRGHADARASDLPHVDRRLVEIARTLATRPAVLLLDEPAAGLSRSDKEALAKLIRRIADGGIAVVLVEHDMTLVMGISDRVVVLDAGARIADGAPLAIQQDPAVRSAYLGEHGGMRARSRRAHSAESAALLETRKLSAGYGAEPVLNQIEIEVRNQEMVAVLGANGAGKSTLMRALAGLHRPVSGELRFAAQDISALPVHRVAALGVVLVPEGRQVFPELSVIDNIRLGGFLRKDRIDADVDAMLERFPQLCARRAQRAGLLSGGEQQMLALARGLMARPRLLLLDEPSLGLAPIVVEELFAALDRLRDADVTILLVDQMAGLALALADRAYVIEAGRIAAHGSAETIAASGALEQAYLGAAS